MQTPRIVSGPHGQTALHASSKIVLPVAATQDGHTPVAIGSWLTNEAVKGLRATATADTAVAYIVTGIFLEDGVTPKANQYLTATEAGSGDYVLSVVPVGGLTIDIEEDGDGGNISDANVTAAPYVTLVVTAPADIAIGEQTADGRAKATANVKIDSSSVNAASTNKILKIEGVAGYHSAIVGQGTTPAHSTGTGRIFRCTFVSAAATETQS